MATDRILIIKPSSLGDIVHTLPMLAALRQAHPDAHIAWLAEQSFVQLLEDHPQLDEVIPFDRRRFGKMARSPRIAVEFVRFLRDIRRRNFDLIVDLQGLFRSGFLAYASAAPQRVGFAAARELAWLFYTERVRCPRGVRHAVDKNLCVTAALGLPADPPSFVLQPRPKESARAAALLAERSIDAFTAVIPGARWKTKRWRADRFGTLIDRIHGDGLPACVLLGAPADREFADQVVAACQTPVVDLVGTTSLRELVALIDRAACVICHDSGPMHIAAALEKPIVAIFGPTDPARTGPYSRDAQVITPPIYCAPCHRRRCWHHSCMQQLDVETVFETVRKTARGVLGPKLVHAAP
jgi:lipopolysaccharide heptosyltransferase I